MLLFQRLGVKFDDYEGEAMYHIGALELVKSLQEKGILQEMRIQDYGWERARGGKKGNS